MRMLDRTWEELSTAMGDHTVAVIPAGSVEQHGLHLPLGVDTFIASALAEELLVSQEVSDFSESGAAGRPNGASAEKGRTLLEASIRALRSLFSWLSGLPREQLASRRKPWTHP